MLRKWVVACAMAVALAVALVPGLAMAAQQEGGDLTAGQNGAPAEVSAQAKKATVYVLTDVNGYTYYKYNKNGLLTSGGYYDGYKFTYKGKNLKKVTTDYGTKYTVKSRNGLVKSATYKSKNYKDVYKYTYNSKGVLTSIKYYAYAKSYNSKTWKKLKKTETYTTDYTIKKGRQAKAVRSSVNIDKSSHTYAPISYSYDKKGNIKKSSELYDDTYTYSYKYKNGRAASRVCKYKYGSYKDTYAKKTFTYKKMKVSKAYAAVVKAQQWALLNNNMNGAFGPVNPGVRY